MATQSSNKLKELLMKKILDFENDSFRLILMQKGFAFSRANHNVYADILSEEHQEGTGYTAGGYALGGATVTKDDVNNVGLAEWGNASWLAAGGNLEADGAIIIDDTVASPVIDPIVGYIDFGQTYLCYDGGTLAVANIAVAVA